MKSFPHIIAIILLALLTGCTKYQVPDGYPTTISKKSDDELAGLRSDFSARNKFVSSSINDFGFCDLVSDPVNPGIPPAAGIIDEKAAIGTVKDFAAENADETGITDTSKLTFSYKFTGTIYNGATEWYLGTKNQLIDTIEVLNSIILFHIVNGKVTYCSGNWYPDIYIPHNFNLSREKALHKLEGKTVYHYTIIGAKYSENITRQELDNSNINLKVLPVKDENSIKLYLCWMINIPAPAFYKMYVDVMTGDIIAEEPTIIS